VDATRRDATVTRRDGDGDGDERRDDDAEGARAARVTSETNASIARIPRVDARDGWISSRIDLIF
jgi:hypothetical protein